MLYRLDKCYLVNGLNPGLSVIARAGRLRVLKCRFFFCRRRRRRVELSDWLAPLIITLFARGDHVWAKYSGQMTSCE